MAFGFFHLVLPSLNFFFFFTLTSFYHLRFILVGSWDLILFFLNGYQVALIIDWISHLFPPNVWNTISTYIILWSKRDVMTPMKGANTTNQKCLLEKSVCSSNSNEMRWGEMKWDDVVKEQINHPTKLITNPRKGHSTQFGKRYEKNQGSS